MLDRDAASRSVDERGTEPALNELSLVIGCRRLSIVARGFFTQLLLGKHSLKYMHAQPRPEHVHARACTAHMDRRRGPRTP
jgi:hypothetical protein